jgi:hypothetical protein
MSSRGRHPNTSSPTFNPFTASPIATTVPERSKPIFIGNLKGLITCFEKKGGYCHSRARNEYPEFTPREVHISWIEARRMNLHQYMIRQ